MQNILVVNDAGHGGKDQGATHKMPIEAYLNLRLAHIFDQWLRKRGITSLMTRTTDRTLSLDERCRITNAIKATCFVSWHCNSHTSNAKGFEVFTSPGDTAADPFAERVIQNFESRYPERAIRVDLSDGDRDKEARFRVLTGTNCPAILVEACFVSNAGDLWWILQEVNQWQLVEIVGNAVIDSFSGQAA